MCGHTALLTLSRGVLLGDAFGGGISSVHSASVIQCLFRNNTALVVGGGQAQGGALSAITVVQVDNTTFESNSAIASVTVQQGPRFYRCRFLYSPLRCVVF